MKALLLAAGLGTRLRPLTDFLPKCLAPICGRPLLSYWFETLEAAGIEEIVVNIHHHADMVRQFVEDGPYATRVRLVYEKELLGTGGTLLANRHLLTDSPVLVGHADNLSVFDPLEFLARHTSRPQECLLTMMTFSAPEPSSCGIVEVDSRGVVTAFHEKIHNPPGNLANAAVYIFDQSIFSVLSNFSRKYIDISTEVIPLLLHRIVCYRNDKLHRDIGTIESLIAAQFELSLLVPEQLNRLPALSKVWIDQLRSGNPSLANRIVESLIPTIGKKIATKRGL